MTPDVDSLRERLADLIGEFHPAYSTIVEEVEKLEAARDTALSFARSESLRAEALAAEPVTPEPPLVGNALIAWHIVTGVNDEVPAGWTLLDELTPDERVYRRLLAEPAPSEREAHLPEKLRGYDALAPEEIEELRESPELIHLYDAHRVVALLLRAGSPEAQIDVALGLIRGVENPWPRHGAATSEGWDGFEMARDRILDLLAARLAAATPESHG